MVPREVCAVFFFFELWPPGTVHEAAYSPKDLELQFMSVKIFSLWRFSLLVACRSLTMGKVCYSSVLSSCHLQPSTPFLME